MICKWADDSQQLILEYFNTIHNSPSQIYQSALPFSPSKSWLRQCYGLELSQGVKVVKGLQAEWGMCSHTVFFDNIPRTLVCWKDLAAVGLEYGDIAILDVITGAHKSVLSEHTGCVDSLTFSSDGTLLVSGGFDKTVNLWDIQTGGVVKSFHGHTDWVYSVSILPDHTMIASGSGDKTIRLWDTWTGDCRCVIIGHNNCVNSVSFSPTNSQLLLSASYDHTVRQWDSKGHQIGPTYEGDHTTFSPDGTCFVLWREEAAIVRYSNSGVVITNLQISSGSLDCCCFSPDGRFVAAAASPTVYVWDIASSNPHLIKTIIGHTSDIISLTFSSSSIISSCDDGSVKFWQIDTDPAATDSEPTLIDPDPIVSVSLQASDGIAISSDSAGVVKTWDILTGHHKASFYTSVKGFQEREARLINDRLIFAWYTGEKIHVWDTKKGKPIQTVDAPSDYQTVSLRISGDGSKVFLLDGEHIQVWSIWTGEVVGGVRLEGIPFSHPPIVDGSKVWVHLVGLQTQGWDFGTNGTTPVLLSGASLKRPSLEFINGTEEGTVSQSRIEDVAAGKEVFQLAGRYAKPSVTQWDGQYLVAGYDSGEVLILDFSYTIPH